MKSFKMKQVLSLILALALFLTCSVPAFAASAFISANEAQTIALAHAGVAAENAIFTKTKLDKKENLYEIEFTCDDDEYEYEINALDGSILDYEWDIEDDEHHTSPTGPDQRPDYRNNIQAAEASALAALGIACENAKYVNSYVKYDEFHIACAIHVEIGIYDKTVSQQTVVYSFDYSMDGQIIDPTVPVEPVNPIEPEPVDPAPIVPVEPIEPEPVDPAPVEPAEPDVPEPVKPEQPNYSEQLQAAEASALDELGIAREDAKYISSYIKYDESHIACAIHVEIGIYDKTVSQQTVVYSFNYSMDGQIIVPTVPVEPVNPIEPEPVDPAPVVPVEPKPVDPAPVEPVEPVEPDAPEPVKPEQTDYSEQLQAAEISALAELGIAREDAKYINSYVKYDESYTACAIRVEVGIYDKTVSPQTIVYRFEFDMNGEIIERPAPVEPIAPVDPAPADPKPVVPVTPDEPDESDEADEYAEPDESDETDPEETEQSQTTNTDKKKTSTKSIKVNSTNVKLKKGQKFTIKVTRNPISATDKITYTTSKKKVAAVSKKGVITAKSKGTCKITVKCSGKKKVIKVTVK